MVKLAVDGHLYPVWQLDYLLPRV